VGSFVNVCVDRMPIQFSKKENRLKLLKSDKTPPFLKKYISNFSLSIFIPIRSFCFNCGYQIKWYENIPVISYFLCKGICRNCKTIIGTKIIITEITHGLFYLASGWILSGWIYSLTLCISFSFFWVILSFLVFSREMKKISLVKKT
tara:strand:+ start:1072 stop:1512 length:441 start_codon:yes stop_codon:yes gene_type:complete